jgi:DNA-binding MltR family transcriptional regulator
MAYEFSEDFLKVFHMTEGESAIPRVTAIICTAYIENHIVELIRDRMPGLTPSLTKSLFNDVHGPLGTVGSKIDMAQALGAINENTASDARLIARIRNRFAHELHVEDFDHRRVRDLVDVLLSWKLPVWVQHADGSKSELDSWKRTRAARFRLAALTTCFEIMRGHAKKIPEIYGEQSPSPDKSETPVQKATEAPHPEGQ